MSIEHVDIQTLLNRKGLNPALFDQKENLPKVENTLFAHIKWVFDNIYSVPYPRVNISNHPEIPRYIHGISHVSRAAYYVPVWANLYRKHNDPDSLKLTQDDIHLLQIAALFHDAARENEGKDYWDHESALLLYYYFTRILNVDKNKAKLIAESAANKDPLEQGYFTINEEIEGQVTFQWGPQPSQKNIYQKLIHDADCLDINNRAVPHFEAKYLDFYKEIASKNDTAFEEMSYLIKEVRALVETEGDAYERTNDEIKKKYNNDCVYSLIEKDVEQKKYHILKCLRNNLYPKETLNELKLTFNPLKSLSQNILEKVVHEGKVFFRGVASPSATMVSHPHKTFAEFETDKTYRKKNISKTHNPQKTYKTTGNSGRSVSNHGVFSNAGYVVIAPKYTQFVSINSKDVGTGRGKNKLISKKVFSKEEIEQQLSTLNHLSKMGGNSCTFAGDNDAFPHNESLCHLKKFDAIYFSPDISIFNSDIKRSPEPAHPYSPILQAIFIQNEYKKTHEIIMQNRKAFYLKKYGEQRSQEKLHKHYGKSNTLPLIEYSFFQYSIREVPQSEYSEEKIIEMWVEMCGAYIQKSLQTDSSVEIYDLSVEDIKIMSMYGTADPRNDLNLRKFLSADANYDPSLKEKISTEIEKKKNTLILAHERKILDKILVEEEPNILNDVLFFTVTKSKQLKIQLKDKILLCINKQIERDLLSNIKKIDIIYLSDYKNEINTWLSSPSTYQLNDLRYYGNANADDISGSPRSFIKLLMLAEQLSDKTKRQLQYQAFTKIRELLCSNPCASIQDLKALCVFYHHCRGEESRKDIEENLTEQFAVLFNDLLKSSPKNDGFILDKLLVFFELANYLKIFPDYKIKMISMLKTCVLDFPLEDFFRRIDYFFIACKKLELDFLYQKKVLLKKLHEMPCKLYAATGNICCLEYFPPVFLRDAEIFEKILNALGTKYHVWSKHDFGFDYFGKHLKILASYMPDKSFSNNQLSQIEKKIFSFGETIIAKSKSVFFDGWSSSPIDDMAYYVNVILKEYPISPSRELLQKFSIRLNELLIQLKNAGNPNEEAIQKTEALQKTIIQKLRPTRQTPALPQTTDSIASASSISPMSKNF